MRRGANLDSLTAVAACPSGRRDSKEVCGSWRGFGNRGLSYADLFPERLDLRRKLGLAPRSPERLRLPFRNENLLCHDSLHHVETTRRWARNTASRRRLSQNWALKSQSKGSAISLPEALEEST
jgi:hypothetical protein